jgi:hypothetical protein
LTSNLENETPLKQLAPDVSLWGIFNFRWKTMLPHAVSMVAAFVDKLVQAPVVMQCPKPIPEPEWKWWAKLAAEIFGPLLSTAGSIYVAWRVFRWAGTKDRENWVRDQKRAEWSTILSSLTAVDIKMPHVFSNLDWGKLTEGLLQELRNVLPPMRNAMFIAEELETENLEAGFRAFVSEAAEKIKAINNLNEFLLTPSGLTSIADIAALNTVKLGKMSKRETAYGDLYDEFHAQANKIRKTARSAVSTVQTAG